MEPQLTFTSIHNTLRHPENYQKNMPILKYLQNIQEVQCLIDSVQDKDQKEHLKRIASNKCSAKLSPNPWEDEYFAMTPDEFRYLMAC